MWAALLAEREGALGDRFACARPEEAMEPTGSNTARSPRVRGARVSSRPMAHREDHQMASLVTSTARLLFIGDSITDDGRTTLPNLPLGQGFVRDIADRLKSTEPRAVVINTGISGDRVRRLKQRWAPDCLDHHPTTVTILIGINDCWRRYDSNDPTTADAFEADYRAILEQAAAAGMSIVLIEPFLLPVTPEQPAGREDLDPKIAVVHKLAKEFSARLIRLDDHFRELVRATGRAALAEDGIHPTPRGHALIADYWLEAAGR